MLKINIIKLPRQNMNNPETQYSHENFEKDMLKEQHEAFVGGAEDFLAEVMQNSDIEDGQEIYGVEARSGRRNGKISVYYEDKHTDSNFVERKIVIESSKRKESRRGGSAEISRVVAQAGEDADGGEDKLTIFSRRNPRGSTSPDFEELRPEDAVFVDKPMRSTDYSLNVGVPLYDIKTIRENGGDIKLMKRPVVKSDESDSEQ